MGAKNGVLFNAKRLRELKQHPLLRAASRGDVKSLRSILGKTHAPSTHAAHNADSKPQPLVKWLQPYTRTSSALQQPTRLLEWAQALMHALVAESRGHVVDSMLAQLYSLAANALSQLAKGNPENQGKITEKGTHDELIKLEGGSKAALVYGQMNEPPGSRSRVGLTGLTVAEYFRDVEGQDVLLFVDNIFRFTQAGAEVSALLGRIPSAVGYQPTLATDMGGLQERITTTTKGSITSVQAIYVPADDLTDPAPATSFAHLDATTTLNRAISELGIYPAVDPLDSTSRILDPRVVGMEHYEVARGVQKVLQDYKALQVGPRGPSMWDPIQLCPPPRWDPAHGRSPLGPHPRSSKCARRSTRP